MRIFKSIFRADYPLNYSLLDKLGEELQFIKRASREGDFENIEGNLDVGKHAISSVGKIRDDIFKINQSLTTLDYIIEFKEGIPVDNLLRHEIFGLTQSLLDRIEQDADSGFKRIGFRSWILIEDEDLDFENLKQFFASNNKIACSAIEKTFGETSDIGIIIESKNESQEEVRISLGPYHEDESKKYFTQEISINEALIFDIDFYLRKIELENFKVKPFVQSAQRIYRELCSQIHIDIRKEVSNG